MTATPTQMAALEAALEAVIIADEVPGPQGATGPQGIPGPVGPQGPAGGTTTTPPPVTGTTVKWATVPPMGNNWDSAHQIAFYGNKYWPESAEKSYSLQVSTNTSAPILRADVKPGDLWAGANGGNDTERAEFDGSAGTIYAIGQAFNIAYSFKVEQGSPLLNTAGGNPGGPAAWFVLGQVHSNNNSASAVPWEMNLVPNGSGASYVEHLQMTIQTDPNQKVTVLWTDPKPFVREQVYDLQVQLQIAGKATDFCKASMNGVSIANYSGIIGSATQPGPSYLKVGQYRGWQGDGIPESTVQIANVYQGTAAVPQPRLAWPTVVSG